MDRPEEGGPRLAHLDRDRRLVEAAQADPARFEALYRKYLAQVYSYAFYELRDHHEAEDATERTFLAALANLARFEERARPADGEGASTFRVWLFQIARNVVAERRRSERRRPEAPLEAAATVAAPVDLEADAARRDEAGGGLAGRSAGCPATGAGRSSCASSTRCRRPRSPACWVAPRARSGSSSTAPCAASRATSTTAIGR